MTPKPVLTVLFEVRPRYGLVASGICEDADVFRNVPFSDMAEATRYLYRKFDKLYHVVANVARNVYGRA